MMQDGLAEVVSWPDPTIAKKFENLGLTASTKEAKSLKSWEHDVLWFATTC
jgi:hypothetical protein